MADSVLIEPPTEVMHAIGTLAIHALANAADPDEGMWLSCPDLSMGHASNVTRIGGWKITVQRVARP